MRGTNFIVGKIIVQVLEHVYTSTHTSVVRIDDTTIAQSLVVTTDDSIFHASLLYYIPTW